MKNTFNIIGGGIAGLTTAKALKQVGFAVQVYEAAPKLSTVGSGITLAQNALNAYRQLGLDQTVMAAGHILKEFVICDKKGKTISRSLLENEMNMIAIHRASLHKILMAKQEPYEIITGKRTVGFEKSADGYKLQFEDGSSLDTPHLIVGEGINSVVRKKLNPDSRLRYAGYT